MTQNTAQTTQHNEHAHRRTGTERPGRRTHNTEQLACTPVNRGEEAQDTLHTTEHTKAGTPVNRSQAAQETAHATPHAERAHR